MTEEHNCTQCCKKFETWQELYDHQVMGHGWGKEDN